MKKTVKILSVLAILLVIFVSCTADITSNGSNGKPSGVINPNIPAAKPEDVDSIITDAKPGVQPSLSEKYLLVNASKSVQEAFADKLDKTELVKNFVPLEIVKGKKTYVDGNKFVRSYVIEDNNLNTINIVQDGATGKWTVSMDGSLMIEGKKVHRHATNALSSGLIVDKEKYVGIVLPAEEKVLSSTSYYENDDYELSLEFETTEEEYFELAKNYKHIEGGDAYSFGIKNPEKKIYAQLYKSRDSNKASIQYSTREIR